MTVYKLEDDPNVFITPTYFGNKFVYRMAYIIKESNNRRLIRNIDLRKDKLRIRESEIQESKLQRLHDSLTLANKQGHIYVNCDGACYFLFTGRGVLCKPIHNVIFDWSPFGVFVPSTIDNSLRKQLEEKAKEVKELQEELSTYVKGQNDKDLELKKVNGKLSTVDFELVSTKNELESSKKAVQVSNEKVIELEKQLSICKKGSEDKDTQLRNIESELRSTELELERSRVNMEEFKNQLCSTKKANEDRVTHAKKLLDELSLAKHELESTKMLLESSEKEVQELKNQSCQCKAEQHHIGDKMRELSDNLHSINSEVRSSNQKVEQVLISMLWNELLPNQQPQLPRFEHESENEHYMLADAQIADHTANKLPVFIKIEDIDEEI